MDWTPATNMAWLVGQEVFDVILWSSQILAWNIHHVMEMHKTLTSTTLLIDTVSWLTILSTFIMAQVQEKPKRTWSDEEED